MQREVLAAARDALDARPGDAFAEGGLVRALDDGDGLTGVGWDGDSGDAPADEARLQVAPYRLYLGQLRHEASRPSRFADAPHALAEPVEGRYPALLVDEPPCALPELVEGRYLPSC